MRVRTDLTFPLLPFRVSQEVRSLIDIQREAEDAQKLTDQAKSKLSALNNEFAKAVVAQTSNSTRIEVRSPPFCFFLLLLILLLLCFRPRLIPVLFRFPTATQHSTRQRYREAHEDSRLVR